MVLRLTKQYYDSLGRNPKSDERILLKIKGLLKEVISDSVYYKTQQNRFWIGEEQYKLMGDFVTLIYRKQELYRHFSPDSLTIIDTLLDKKRGQIDSVIIKMLK